MAVINTADDQLTHPLEHGTYGARTLSFTKVIAIASGDENASKFLIGEVPGEAIIDSITLEVAAITGGTGYDVGLYEVDGTAINDDVFAAALDLSDVTGLGKGPLGDEIRHAMTALAAADVNKPVWELAGHVNKTLPGVGETLKRSKYRIVLTADTIGSADANIVARVTYRMAV